MNAPNHDDNVANNNANNNDSVGKKTLVSTIAGILVAPVVIALSAAVIYGRRCHRGGKNNNVGRDDNLAKVVPMLSLVDNNIKNLCDGSGNNGGNAYHGFYYCAALLENVLKMQDERVGKTRACAVSRGQARHRLFLVKRQDRGPLCIMHTHHLKVSKSKTTWPNHMDKRYKRYEEMLTWPKDMQGTRVRETK